MELNTEQNNNDIQTIPKNKLASPTNENNNSLENSENSATKESSTEVEVSLSEAKEILEKCKDIYKNHKIEEAHRLLKQIYQIRDALSGQDLEELTEILKNQEEMFEELEREYAYLMQIKAELDTDEGWKTEELGPKSRISNKMGDNNRMTLRMETEIDVPVLHLIAMINEVELWKLWNPIMNKTAEVGTVHRASKVYYVEYGLPYPLANREIHLYGVGVNRLYENGTVVIMAKSVDDDNEFFQKHGFEKYQHKGAVNINVHLGGFEITPLSRTKCLLRGVTNIDPRFDWIPGGILNWILKKGTQQMVEKIASGAKNFKGSAWEKEINSERKRDFYIWLEDQLEQYHSKQEKEKEKAESQ
jgi:hypothetical protein